MKHLYDILGFPDNNTIDENTDTIVPSRVGFDDIKRMMNRTHSDAILINTLPENLQHCLILNTKSIQDEITWINQCIDNKQFNLDIYIYGKNHTDGLVERKQTQLKKMGFRNVFVYLGGLFEWLLLQDIYGKLEFPTTSKQTDLLQYSRF